MGNSGLSMVVPHAAAAARADKEREQRRLRALLALSEGTRGARSLEECLSLAARALDEAGVDACLYALDERVRLVARAGTRVEEPAIVEALRLGRGAVIEAEANAWFVSSIGRGAALAVAGEEAVFHELVASMLTSALANIAPPRVEPEPGRDLVATERRRPRVLCVDADEERRDDIARILQGHYEVRTVVDGDEARAAARENPPDLVLLDVMLPGREDVLAPLRGAEDTDVVPVILLSSRESEDAALEGLEAGADDYLAKPFSGRALIARVRSHLALAALRKDAADELALANKELDAFSYAVAHDLRAPLRALDGFSRLLEMDYGEKLDDEGRGHLHRIRSGTQRMAQLIDDLLGLSRITRRDVNPEAVNLTSMARAVFDELGARDPQRKVTTVVADELTARGDYRLLMVLIESLLGNAWKFSSMNPAPRIEVGREIRDGETIFFVRDNGAGFDMAHAKKLFAPFQRLHAPTEFPGAGIGLATVHRVIARHGGRIWGEAAPQKGATFFFTLGASR